MTQPPPANPYASSPAPMRPEDEKLWAILTHVGGLLFPLLAPLIIYLVLRDRGPFIRQHSATALNFHLTMAIGSIIAAVTAVFIIGFFLAFAIGILVLALGVMAALAASRGEYYTYPLAITFVR